MRLKGKLKGNIVRLPQNINVENEKDVFVEIPEYDYAELDKKDLSEVIDIIWSGVGDSIIDNRDYREILTDALLEKYGEKD